MVVSHTVAPAIGMCANMIVSTTNLQPQRKEPLRFETLWAEVSARFVGPPSEAACELSRRPPEFRFHHVSRTQGMELIQRLRGCGREKSPGS